MWLFIYSLPHNPDSLLESTLNASHTSCRFHHKNEKHDKSSSVSCFKDVCIFLSAKLFRVCFLIKSLKKKKKEFSALLCQHRDIPSIVRDTKTHTNCEQGKQPSLCQLFLASLRHVKHQT